MIRAMFSAATGMVDQQTNIDTIANNMANVNTAGFKKSRVNFQDLLYETLRPAGAHTAAGEITPEGIQIGHGVRPASVAKLFTPGTFLQTGNALDVAIEGDGFFQVTMPDGTFAYTRDGSFRINSQGTMMTVDGLPLADGITFPTNYVKNSVSVGPDGMVSVDVPGSGGVPSRLGTLQLTIFPNPSGLDASLGRNLLTETEASGTADTGNAQVDGRGSIAKGFLEASNVQVVEEIINMIVAQRAYEANSKVIQSSDEMLQIANNVRR